jgi:hypothetical protein
MRTIRALAGRGWVMAALAVIFAAGFVAAIVAAPWLMRSFVGRSDDWRKLSDVGQAYGGISAILSGLAFCGIACSLLLQWRQIRINQIMTNQERHFELVKMRLDDPTLDNIMNPPGVSPAEARKWTVFNLWVSYWEMLWDTRSEDRLVLRGLLDGLFADSDAVTWWSWARTGGGWSRAATGHRRRRAFVAMADDAHRDARVGISALAGRPSSEGRGEASPDVDPEPRSALPPSSDRETA